MSALGKTFMEALQKKSPVRRPQDPTPAGTMP